MSTKKKEKKDFHLVTSCLVLTTCFTGKGKSKVEFPSAEEMSERMLRHMLTPRGKAPTSSSEPIALDDEPSVTPLPVARASTLRLPKHKREDEEWHFALTVPQGFSLQKNHHTASQIGGALMTEADSCRLLSQPFTVLCKDYYGRVIQVNR